MTTPLSFWQIWWNSYLRPRRALQALARSPAPQYGLAYTLLRAAMLSLAFFLPLYLLEIQPISPAYLSVFDRPDYFLIEAFIYPVFSMLSWLLLSGLVQIILRLSGYPSQYEQILNLNGLIALTIGIVLLAWDWLLILLGWHTFPTLVGISHVLIADPWGITLSTIYLRAQFGVPVWLSILLGILTRLVFIPITIPFIRT